MRLPRTWQITSYNAEPVPVPIVDPAKNVHRIRWTDLRDYLLEMLEEHPAAREKIAQSLAAKLGLLDNTEIDL